MEDNNMKNVVSTLRNIKGKKLLEETLLNYSKSIIVELEKNPQVLPEILEILDMDQNEFLQNLQNTTTNITFYDEALTLVRNKNNKIEFNSSKTK